MRNSEKIFKYNAQHVINHFNCTNGAVYKTITNCLPLYFGFAMSLNKTKLNNEAPNIFDCNCTGTFCNEHEIYKTSQE